ncbi:uncharacterized protein LOC124809472 [Hydra vulgaris]|uniref:uncharacterized protein LOC124809472 n=1 Tax=Hydra vulgaris TaxID=6087 RepID=UPI001F5FDA13|nr:RING-H2 finger protein ATL32-like [Hydra vulgaris]
MDINNYILGIIFLVILLLCILIRIVRPYVSCCCLCSWKPKDGELMLLEESGEIGTTYRSIDCGLCYFVYTKKISETKLVWIHESFKTNKNFSRDDVCVICLESLENDATVLNCNHSFHNKCIRKWLFKNESKCCLCPLCQKVIFSQKIHLGVLSNSCNYPIESYPVHRGYHSIVTIV